jgi:hypothetical protein
MRFIVMIDLVGTLILPATFVYLVSMHGLYVHRGVD